MMTIPREKIDENLRRVRERIAAACDRAGRSPNDVRIIAVTKSVDLESVLGVIDAGVQDLGESRVQQLVDRAADVAAALQYRRPGDQGGIPIQWHMIGALQRNKVRPILDVRPVIHSIDSLRLAEEINTRAERNGQAVPVLLEVNCSAEEQKHGVAVGAAIHLAELLGTLKHLRLIGLMTMAQQTENMEETRPVFARLRELFEEMRGERVGGEIFRHLSMGMSQDYPVAVEEGATMVRVGSALFE